MFNDIRSFARGCTAFKWQNLCYNSNLAEHRLISMITPDYTSAMYHDVEIAPTKYHFAVHELACLKSKLLTLL